MLDKLQSIKEKHLDLQQMLADPKAASDQARYRKLNKEYSDLKEIVQAYDHYSQKKAELDTSRQLLKEETDQEMKELVQAEISELQKQIPELEQQLKVLLLPKEEADSRNVIIEIRAGTGGEEAALFTADLTRMYQRYAEQQGWQYHILHFNESSVPGGFREMTLEVSGNDVYGTMKYESGVHRVQRVPDTETQGRIHTSAVSVAVLPEAEEVDVEIRREDLRFDTYRSGGKGGQNVNKVETAVRITHIPSGIVSACQEQRSQLQNKEMAMQMLRTKLYDIQLAEQQQQRADLRRSMVTTGDRSAKIRTYNYPQSRVTDHRIGYTSHALPQILQGDIQDIIDALKMHDQAERLQSELM
ncbi:MAG: peptide chain release factor 1 [Chlorobium sp.]